MNIWILIHYFVAGIILTDGIKPGGNCVVKSQICAERRMQNHAGLTDILPIFQDAIYHYCLDLYGCQVGKELVCHNVGKSESDYPDPTLRRHLIRQCGLWKIQVRFARQGDMTAHYVFLRSGKNNLNVSKV